MASTSNLSTDIALIQEFYRRKALMTRVFENGLLGDATRSDIPKNNSKVAHFHKWNDFGLAETVAEATEPVTGVAADVTEVKVEMQILSKFINIPLEGDEIRIDSLVEESYPRFTQQLERTANRKLMTAINAGNVTGNNSFQPGTVLYANGKQTFGALNASDNLTSKDIQRAVALLRKKGAKKIGGSYRCALNPWGEEDLMVQDQEFRDILKMQSISDLKKGKVVMWGGATIIDQEEPFRETLGGTEGTYAAAGEVITTYVYGDEAFGVTQLLGKTGLKPKFKVQDTTRTGSIMSIGWRTYFAGVVLDPAWVIQIKSVASNPAISSVA